MQGRPPKLQAFLEAVRLGFDSAPKDPDTARTARDVFALIDSKVGPTKVGNSRVQACAALPAALDSAEKLRPELAAIATAFRALEPSVIWSQSSGRLHASDNFLEGHANATVLGPGGLEQRTDVWVGISLLAPHVRYPDHQHAPEEVYLVLSPGQFRQANGDWFKPGPGGNFYNKPNIVHAMRSEDVPLFAVWCLHHAK